MNNAELVEQYIGVHFPNEEVELHTEPTWNKIGYRVINRDEPHLIKQWVPTENGCITKYLKFYTDRQVEVW